MKKIEAKVYNNFKDFYDSNKGYNYKYPQNYQEYYGNAFIYISFAFS